MLTPNSRCPRRRTIHENGKPVRGASILLLDEDAGTTGDVGIPDVNLGGGTRACQADAYLSIAAHGQHIACQIDVGVFDEGTAQFYGWSRREYEREAVAHGWRACRLGCACPDENLPRCCARLKGYGIPSRAVTLDGTGCDGSLGAPVVAGYCPQCPCRAIPHPCLSGRCAWLKGYGIPSCSVTLDRTSRNSRLAAPVVPRDGDGGGHSCRAVPL
jgi:hypothetical protein